MTEHPTPSIPPIDPAYIEEVKQLVGESTDAVCLVAGLARRVGIAMEQMDILRHAAGGTDVAEEELRAITGYGELLDIWYAIAGHATAAADHRAYMSQPDWYEQLIERRHARYAAEVA
ncbi:MAG TPA: hypothetical protein VGV63_01615 [Acidimicrobiales bacterium]|nr:hypothetical protein [Acidimicrobiales bacterium]